MWVSRLWFLVILVLAALMLSGALTLPGFRDDRIGALRDRVAEVEAAAITAAVDAELADLRRATQLAALEPDLIHTLTTLPADVPAPVARSLVERELARLGERNPRIDFLLVAPDGGVRGASPRLAAEAVALARLPLIKAAQSGGLQVAFLNEEGTTARTVVAVPLPESRPVAEPGAPEPPREALGVLLATARGPAAAALAAHAALHSDARIVTLTQARVQDTTLPIEAQAAVVSAARPEVSTVPVEGVPWRTRRFALAAAPGAAFILVWPTEPPASLSDAGGITGLFSRALARTPETAVLVGALTVLWLLGVLVGEMVVRRSVRRGVAELEALAAGPELVPVDPAQVPPWLRPLLAAGGDAAEEVRRKVLLRTAHAAESSEISAERVLDDAEPERPRLEIGLGKPAAASRPSLNQRPSTPPAGRPGGRPVDRPAASVHPPSDPPEHFLSPRPPSAAPAPLEAERLARRGLSEPARPAARPSLSQDARSADLSVEAELRPGEGTAELPGRRVGAAPRDRLSGARRPQTAPPEEVTREVTPRRPLFDRPLPAEIEDDEEESDVLSTDHGHLPRGRTSDPPAVDEGPDDGSLFDLSSPPAAQRWLSEPPEATSDSTDGSLQVPAGRRPGLLAQLISRGALDPEARPTDRVDRVARLSTAPPPEGLAGESTVVRPIPMSLLDASTSRDPDQTAVGPPPSKPERDGLERVFEQVFEEFVAVKRTCGEPTHTLDYARFRAKLVRTRKSLMERFACQDVRFRVYVKDGRAALKAAPLIDGDEGEETFG